jgi:2-C-methyl-D-erythritol 4-phosphate cytidylyltransferase
MVNQNHTDAPTQVTAVIPAAGTGIRMGSKKAKQFLDLGGKPLLAITLRHFQESHLVDRIIVVVSQQDVDYCLQEIVDTYNLSKVFKVISGGKSRQDSVRNGIEAVPHTCRWVLIHDGVRPLVTKDLIQKAISAAQSFRAVTTGLPITESVKEVDSQGRILRSIDRSDLWLIQTPQIFRREDIHLAHQEALEQGWKEATDDAFLIEKMGIPVKIIKGEESNIKVTTPLDLQIARFLMLNEST